jgi:hypothetical protein
MHRPWRQTGQREGAVGARIGKAVRVMVQIKSCVSKKYSPFERAREWHRNPGLVPERSDENARAVLIGRNRVHGLVALIGTLFVTAVAQGQTPISSCATITTSGFYALMQNLVPTSSICITIAANEVILDLNGFGIDQTSGGSPHSSIGISDAGVTHGELEIRNGFMRGLRSAIILGSSRVWIHDVRFSDIAEGAVQVGSGSLIQRLGFRSVLDQIAIKGTDHVEVEDNILDGAGMTCGPFCLFTGNSISDTVSGIQAGDGAFIADNALNNIGGDGIVVGIEASLFKNTLTGQGLGSGIIAGTNAKIDTIQVSGFDVGIVLESDGSVITALVTGSGHSGIVAGPRSVIESSNSSGNGSFGIQLAGSGSLVRYNHLSLNQGLAIDCTTGSGSRAAHNSFSGNARNDTTCLSWGNKSF